MYFLSHVYLLALLLIKFFLTAISTEASIQLQKKELDSAFQTYHQQNSQLSTICKMFITGDDVRRKGHSFIFKPQVKLAL